MATALTFTKQGDKYIATLPAPKGVVQMTLTDNAVVAVLASANGIDYTPIDALRNQWSTTFLFEVDIPTGLSVKVETPVAVTTAIFMPPEE